MRFAGEQNPFLNLLKGLLLSQLRAPLTITFVAALAAASIAPAYAAISGPTAADLQLSANFLSNQLSDGLATGPSGADDLGLTQDMLLSLDAVDPNSSQAQQSFHTMMDSLDSYLYLGGEVDAARLAKTVVVADAFEQPNAVLIAQLVDTVQDNGQLKNETAGEPTSGVTNFGQAWGVLALARAGETAAAERAADFLATQICANGGVPLSQLTEPTCTTQDADTTALAAQAFALVDGTTADSTTRTVNYLSAAQDASGGISGFRLDVNANTTALAASAFALVNKETEFSKAHAYLESTRFGASASTDLAGAFAWRSSDVATATTVTDQIRRTSAQAALAYAGANYANDNLFISVTPPTSEPTPAPAPAPEAGSSAGSAGIIIAVVALLAAIAAAVGPLLLNLPA